MRENNISGCHKKHSNPDKELATAARGGGIGLIGMVSSRLLSLFIQAAIARLFGITFFGYYITGVMLCRILEVVAGMGLPIGSVRFMVQSLAHGNRPDMYLVYRASIFGTFLAGSILGFSFYIATSFLCNSVFNEPDLVPVLQLFSFAIPCLSLLRVLAELSRSFGTVRYTVIVENFLFPLIQICILLFAYIGNFDSVIAVLSFLTATFLCAAIMGIIVYRQIRQHIFTQPDDFNKKSSFSIRELYLYSLPLMPTGIFFIVSNNIDIFMLNIFNSGGAVGIYAAATRWTLLVDSIGVPINVIFRPLIAKAISVNDSQMLRSLLMASSRWVLYLILPFIACLTVASQPAMDLFLKEDAQGIASILLWTLLAARITNPLGNSAGIVLTMGGQQYRELVSLACGAGLNVVLNAILIPEYGVIGAAIATGAGFYLTTIFRISFTWQRWGIVPWSNRMIIPLSALCAVIVIHSLMPHAVPSTWQIAGGGISACFVACCVLFFGWEQDDKNIAILLPKSVQNFFARMLTVVHTYTSKVIH